MSDLRSRARRVAAAAALAGAVALPVWAQQGWQTVTSARQIAGERRLDVEVQYGAGELRIAPGTGNLLYRMQLRYDDRAVRPLTHYDRAAGRLRLGVESAEKRRRSTDMRGGRAEISLTPEVPLALRLQFGAGEADVRLGGLAVTDLRVSTGASESHVRFDRPNRAEARRVRLESGAADLRVSGLGNARAERIEFDGGVGETTLDFGGAWTRDTKAVVKMGIGSVTLRLPRTLGVRIVNDSFLASFDSGGMVKRGNAWYSPGYDRAGHKLDVEINAAMGSIKVDWID